MALINPVARETILCHENVEKERIETSFLEQWKQFPNKHKQTQMNTTCVK